VHLKLLGKQEAKPKSNRWKKIKIGAEINKMETKRTKNQNKELVL
jgi:hypothetical protein